ncbi:MAG: zinc ribbon domain-containing protein [Candidatus Zixiibacteriota bacterium]
MPIFEYRCTECEARFEELVADPGDLVECPKCHSKKAERLLSVFATNVAASPSNSGPSCGSGGCCNCSGMN